MIPEDSKIIYPLPGDRNGKPIGTFVTDSEGKYSGQIQFNEPGRYSLHVSSMDGRVKTNPVVIQILPKCRSKGDIRQGNKLIRATIRAALTKEEIESQVGKSRLYLDCAPENLRKVALKQYEETTKNAHKRIEELRLMDRKFGISVDPQKGFSLAYEVRKNPLQQ